MSYCQVNNKSPDSRNAISLCVQMCWATSTIDARPPCAESASLTHVWRSSLEATRLTSGSKPSHSRRTRNLCGAIVVLGDDHGGRWHVERGGEFRLAGTGLSRRSEGVGWGRLDGVGLLTLPLMAGTDQNSENRTRPDSFLFQRNEAFGRCAEHEIEQWAHSPQIRKPHSGQVSELPK